MMFATQQICTSFKQFMRLIVALTSKQYLATKETFSVKNRLPKRCTNKVFEESLLFTSAVSGEMMFIDFESVEEDQKRINRAIN